jgi:hypothetical protein
MKIIDAANIDSKFWNIENLSADILKSIESTGQAIINFKGEGPAFKETNLYKLLKYLKKTYNVDLSRIKIITGNLVEDCTQEYKVEIQIESLRDFKFIQQMLDGYNSSTEKNSDAKKFGIFISRSNYPRLALTGHMFSNYKESTLLTYHYDSSSDYHKAHLGIEELIYMFNPNSDIVNNALNLLRATPIIIGEKPSYPLVEPECYKLLSIYNQFYVEIICETYFSGNTFYPTEKTWRALAMKTPFVIQGPSFYLQRLRDIGFKTFNNWWDESYDEDPYNYKLTAIMRIIDEINSLDIKQVYKEMLPVLEHNYELFQKLNFESFDKIMNDQK